MNSTESLRERLTKALTGYEELQHLDANSLVEVVLNTIASAQEDANGELNPHFENRLACELLFDQLKATRSSRASNAQPVSDTKAPLDGLHPDQQVVAFLIGARYSREDLSELLQWSPRKTNNLLSSVQTTLQVRSPEQISVRQLRFVRDAGFEDTGCPTLANLWASAHGEQDADQIHTHALHAATCGRCTEIWRLAWALEHELCTDPLIARSITEDLRYNSRGSKDDWGGGGGGGGGGGVLGISC